MKYLPVKLCNAFIFKNLCCIHFISELPTIAEKEAVKHLCGASGAKSYKRVIKEDYLSFNRSFNGRKGKRYFLNDQNV